TKLKKGDIHGILSPRPMTSNIPGYVREAGSQLSIPTMFAVTFFAENGGLASYTPDSYESGRMAARPVDKILKGAKPSEIPVEVNHNIVFVVNLKIAKAPYLPLPPSTALDISLSHLRCKTRGLVEFYASHFAPRSAASVSARKADFNRFQRLRIQNHAVRANTTYSQQTNADSLKLPY